MKKMFSKKGFTLIELLIVITIIGILAAALLPSILGAPAKARDTARKADVNNIITAVEAYNLDNGNYPGTDQTPTCVSALAGMTKYFPGGTAPKDPGSKGTTNCATGYSYCKLKSTAGQNYMIGAYVEQKANATTDDTAVSTYVTKCPADNGATLITLTAPTNNGPWAYAIIK